MGIDRSEWLDAIHAHYYRIMVTPVHAAAEIPLGRTDPGSMASSISRRGRKIGDDVMATTTAADCADAVAELVSSGFLESVFDASCPSCDDGGCLEHVLELRMPV
ncbi:hypothetical protein AAV95_09115 [Mycolicibacterium elephantis]|uniref:hypothetical protein n=1 Tax=Mycolicibacterium elephantis TaxID=81858 RepID=UPI000629CD04|nr:hypothetical protein [Mycolicibacterium elephantis]KKW64990.1 hypothetical protein AAV95_09115 [Mycolicibacterium elephantis]